MNSTPMTAAEAERRLDSIYCCGGTPDERRYAIRRWLDALEREWKVERAKQRRETAEAVR